MNKRTWRSAATTVAGARSAGITAWGAAAVVALAIADPGAAVAQPDPQDGHVWAGCTLSSGEFGTVEAIESDILNSQPEEAEPFITSNGLQIAFVVVYALTNDNDGQPLRTSGGEESEPAGFTGPILCTNPSVTGIEETTQTATIPDPSTEASSIDALDAEDAFILRYVLNDGDFPGTTEKVICHTVNDHTDCFRISPIFLGD